MISLFAGYSWWALLGLRVFVGIIFFAHGTPKIKNLKQTAQNFEMMGFKPGNLWGPFIAILEFFGGILLILGWFTQLLALLFAVEMLVATFWKIKSGQKFIDGFELDFLLVLSCLILLTSGAGYYAFDNYWPIKLY